MMSETVVRKTPRELRAEVEQLMRDDLIGPLGGPEEELRDPPVDQYLLGLLSPRRTLDAASQASNANGAPALEDEDPIAADALPDDDLAGGTIKWDTGAEGTAEDRPPSAEQLVPSAFGLTFAVDADCVELAIDASWGAYSQQTSEEKRDHNDRPARVWRRRPCGGRVVVRVGRPGAIKPLKLDANEPQVVVRGIVREREGHRLVSLFLVNEQVSPGKRAVPLWLCQSALAVTAVDDRPVFVRRRIDAIGLAPAVDREEIAGLEMQYRSSIELAVGHGVGVHVTEAPDEPGHGTRLQTEVMPAAEVPLTEAPEPRDFSDDAIRAHFEAASTALDMRTLAEAGDGRLPALLTPLADAYEAWITAQERRIGEPDARLEGFADDARRHLGAALATARRIRAGIAALADPDVAEAFRFANHAMWQQRVHTIAAESRRRDDALRLHDAVSAADVPRNRSWRPFQLAFVLLNLPSLADPSHPERTAEHGLVDLLFFPTGGGKTEAYLGLTAFAIAIRRLQGTVDGRDGRDGVAVLMRYTLRLLTLQQFQRAAALLCACELRRRALYGSGKTAEQKRWGSTPMRIGLWVGQASTPNSTEDAENWVKQARQGRSGARLVADAARALPVVRVQARRRARHRRRSRARPHVADVLRRLRAVRLHAAQQP